MVTKNRALLACTGILVMLSSLGTQATDRKFTYACEVLTQAGVSGLVLIQADNMQDAQAAAVKAEAITIGGQTSPAMSVVQCIETPKGRFTDSQFQRFYEELPR
ncbi:MAG: hypothetical protein KDI09_02415 [Halioglobus sp.]|nr:hypothetical protein [Halioglobus sp.]